jgi:hypothetical protein
MWSILNLPRPSVDRPASSRCLYIERTAIHLVKGKSRLLFAGLALVALLVGSAAAASQPARGFVAYQVSFTSPKGEHSVLVNETVGPSAKAGYSDLILQLFGTQENLSYSKIVNSSEILFPYLPSVAPQSFSYSNGTKYSVHVNFTAAGTTTVKFRGGQYTLNVLVISFSATYGARNIKGNGTVETFPSTLVYSAAVGNNTARLQAVLQATDLPLISSSPQMTTAAYVGAGAGIGALALAGAFLMRRREKRAKNQEEKPLHWVD